MKKKIIIILCTALILLIYILYYFNIIPHHKYSNAHFNITTYQSKIDKDNDGIDDATDILNNVKKYLTTNPQYGSKYYAEGYPTDNYGVCTDVVAFGLRDAGYDLKELVNIDIKNHPEDYNIEIVDKNIDFRRVNNLRIYFLNNAITLTTDPKKIAEWQGGDIVVFENHIGIISDKRNYKGLPFVYHLAPHSLAYEEDILSKRKIIAHFRIS